MITKKVILHIFCAALVTGCGNGLISDKSSPLSFLVFNNDLKVTDISPAAGAIDVPTASLIQAVFSADLAESSVSSSTFVVADDAYIPVPGSLSYDTANRKVIFAPAALLLNLVEYNVLIATDITDVEGNSLIAEKFWHFTTISSGTVPAPVFNPPPGTYNGPQSITLECQEPVATIRYTIDGSMPTSTTGTVYSGPITVNKNSVNPIHAIAYRDGFTDSSIAAASYVIKVLPPVLEPPPGQYSSNTTITITTATAGADIKYTLDGTDPATSGTAILYSSPFTIILGTTVNAVAIDPLSTMANSTVITASYFIDYAQVAPPVFAPPIGIYTSSLTVALSTSTAGATIKYTIDGSDPSASNGAVGTSVRIADVTVLKAFAYKSGMADSIITNSAGIPYIIAPVITAIVPGKGANLSPVTVIIKGKNFKSGAGARLRLAGHADIIGTSLTVIDSTQMNCTFDITGVFQTKWDLVVENTDGGSSTNVKYFRIY
ncbi:MAG TPA: chitobiase/beta-hexosaminidase C-terminal domain-containing protein [Spirochaetota bacterium]|nr:chitobiase/beta-hexosaminidase C-terminal domain-containing protein [Spirochaetota bacterium]HPC39855.1 chitobiase/beta-hexosaminidase C-terminal domain-containing protein [Spirochaetota bacterium]HPL16477.1 chitobiase/beta-hexosaminidase C-terminal domain-containing protein [Spirochaetota bacterium]HQF08969.1 chitobiase/beta-hexosaminidase C-terminal domain-containing protein [Spirochaetota bacterium]HQH98777.1 chitobiase/beta-hexosaminidase C-terminal domain-containing protein [Spirochaeto